MQLLDFKEQSEKDEIKGTNEEIDETFWRKLPNETLCYTYDLSDSFFDKEIPWNLNKLDSLLKYIRCPLPGITTSCVYFGKPKQWYSIPPKFKSKFEDLARKLFPEDSKKCDHFLKHKTTIISQNHIIENGIPIYLAIQEPGEFIVTFPSTFHSEFNYGFNCVESSNFALKPWLDHAKNGHNKCVCSSNKTNWDFDMNNFQKAIKGESNYGDIVVFKDL